MADIDDDLPPLPFGGGVIAGPSPSSTDDYWVRYWEAYFANQLIADQVPPLPPPDPAPAPPQPADPTPPTRESPELPPQFAPGLPSGAYLVAPAARARARAPGRRRRAPQDPIGIAQSYLSFRGPTVPRPSRIAPPTRTPQRGPIFVPTTPQQRPPREYEPGVGPPGPRRQKDPRLPEVPIPGVNWPRGPLPPVRTPPAPKRPPVQPATPRSPTAPTPAIPGIEIPAPKPAIAVPPIPQKAPPVPGIPRPTPPAPAPKRSTPTQTIFPRLGNLAGIAGILRPILRRKTQSTSLVSLFQNAIAPQIALPQPGPALDRFGDVAGLDRFGDFLPTDLTTSQPVALSLAQAVSNPARKKECECEETEEEKEERRRPSSKVATVKTFSRRMSQNSLDNLRN